MLITIASLAVIAGEITAVADNIITVERTARVLVPPHMEAGGLNLGAFVVVRARRTDGQYIADSISLTRKK